MLPSLPPLGSTADIERAIGSLVNAVLTTKEEKLTWVARVLSTLAYDCLSRAEKGLVRLYLQQKTGYSRAQVARMILSAHREILTKTIRAHRFLEYVTTPKGFALLGCALVTVLALHGSDRSVADILGVSKTDAIRHHIRMLETQPADSSAEQPHVAVTPTAEIRTMQARVDQRRASRMNAEGITVSPEVFVPTETTAPSPNTASTANAAVPSTELTAKNSRLWDILGVGSEGQVLMIQHGQPTWGTLAVHMAAPAEPVRFAPANRGGGGGGSEAPSRRGGGGSENATSTNTNTTTTITTTVTTANGWTSATGLVYLTTTGDAVGIGTATPETKLEVIGTVSGSLLHAQDALTSSGTFVFEGAASGSSLYLASAFNGAGLTDCSNSSSSKLLWNSSTGRFSCGTDQTVGTGLSISTGDARYLKDAGGTLTGVLAVTVTGGNNATVGINVVNAISGAVIHAEKTLTTSGTLVFEGAASGASLYIGTSFNGAGLVTCSNATTSKLLWNSSTGRFSCGTDAGIVFGSGQVFAIGDARYLKQSGGTLTGALTVNVTGGTKSTTGLNVVNTISGAIVHGEKTLTSSGTLVFEGAASGSSLYLGTSLNGAGLTSCSTGSTSKLLWNSSTGRFSCGTDTDTTYTAGQGLTLASTALSLNATLTGTMIKFQTLSGNTLNIQANNTSYIQGNTVIGIATTADTKLEVIGTASGTVLYANKTLASSGTLVFKGAGSGASLYIGTNFQGAGLTDCDTAGSSKLLWDATTGRFSCGSDQNSGGSSSFSSGNLFAIGDARYLKQSGGTVTGALTVNITGGNKNTIAINVVNTISGAIVHGEKTLTSSGTLVFEGAASGASLYLGTSLNGAGLTTCSDGTASKLLWNSSTGRFSCGTDQTVGSGLSQSAGDERYINTAGDTMTGSLTLNITGGVKSTLAINAVNTISGAILHAEKTLTSSGTLVFEGAASGSSLYLGTSLTGAGLSSCSNGTTSKLLWNSTTGRFSCGTDTDTNSGAFTNTGSLLGYFDPRYVNTSGDTMTGSLTLNITGGVKSTLAINAVNTISGAILHAEKTLTSSGTFVFEGAASGSSLYVATSLNGSGLVDCDTASTSKLLWDATTGRFSCGSDTDTNTVTSAGRGLTVTSGVLTLNATLTGTTLRGWTTISGSLLTANTLTSSGTLVFEGAASGSSLYLGTSLTGAGLSSCSNGTTSKLLWNSTTGRFSCGTDTDTNSGAFTNTGSLLGYFDPRYVNTSGDTMTGALTLNITGGVKSTLAINAVNTISGAILHAEKTLTSSGTFVFEGAGSGAQLYVGTNFQGAGLSDCDTAGTSKLLWDITTGRFSCGSDTDTNTVTSAGRGLTVTSGVLTLNATLTGTTLRGWTTISGSLLTANTLTSSGTLVFEGAASGSSLYLGTSLTGAGLSSCSNGTTSKLLWNSTTGRFSCGTDTDTNSGAFTNTGSLLGYFDPRYVNTSGDTMTGALTLNITGGVKSTLAINAVNTISGAILHAEKTLTSSGTFVFEGAASGSSLYVATSLNGSGLVDCDTASTSKLLWDATTGRFSCGSDTDTNTVTSAGRGLTVTSGVLTLNATLTGTTLRGWTTISGSLLTANTLTSSGTLVFEGAASGSSLYLGTSLTGAGLSSCSNGTTSKLLWNSTTGRFSCGTDTDTNTTYTVGQGLTLTSTVIRLNATVTGSLVQAVTTLASSGTLVFEGAASGSSLYLGTSLNGAGLTDCDTAGSSKLLWDATTGRFSCGSDQNSGGGSSFSSGQLLTIGNARYLSKAGGTATGALMVNITGGVKSTVGLNVVNTISGAILHAEKTLTSSGTFVFEGAASGSSLYLGTSLQGAGLTDCDTAGSSKLLWDTTTGRFSCGSDQGGGGLVIKKKTVDENLTDDNTLQNDDELYFAVAANETWVYRFSLKTTTGDTIAAWKFAVAAPASSTCQMTVTLIENNVAPQNGNSSTCGAAVSISPATTTDETVEVFGSIKTAGTAGSGSLQWAQNAVQMGMTNTVYAGSMLTAFKTVGSDLAEVYQTREANLLPGMVVALDSTLTAGVKMSAVANDPHILGVLSTKPALVIGGDDLEGGPGLPVFVALSGRVPVMVSTENGAIRPGDFLTSSSKKGIAMRATRVGAPVIGQAMTGYDGEEVGVVTIFIKNTSLAIDPSIEPLTGSGTPLASSGSVLPISNHSGSFVDMVSAEVTKQIDAFKIQWISEQRATSNEQPVLSGSQLEADTLSLEHTLTVGTDARIAGDLHVEGSFVISDLIVPGALHIDQLGTHVTGLLAADTLTISSGALIHGTLTLGGDVNLENGSVRFGSGTVTLDHLIARESLFVLGNITIQGLATFLGDVAVHGELSVSPKQAGFAVIPSSETSVTVLFGTGFRLTPVVTASPDTPILYAVSQTTQTGFVIHLAAPNSEPVRFSWHALSTEILSSSSLPLRSSEGAEGGQSSEPILSDVGSSSSENSVTLSTVEGSSESSSSSISSLSSSEQSSSSQESLASAQSSDEAGSESLSSASSSAE